MPDSHRWIESNICDCLICNKCTYVVFIWNKRIAAMQIEEESKQNKDNSD